MMDFSFPDALALLIGLAVLAFDVWMLWNVYGNDELPLANKLLWMAGIIFFSPFGGLAYFFIVFRRPDV